MYKTIHVFESTKKGLTAKKVITLLHLKGFLTLSDGYTFNPDDIEVLNIIWDIVYPTSSRMIVPSQDNTTLKLVEK